jgi:hypothetical protein
MSEEDPQLTAKLREALAELDACATAEEVAAKLLSEGCKGVRADCATCPVAVWICRKLGRVLADGDVLVHDDCAYLMDPRTGRQGLVDLTAPVQAFIRRMDRCWYPELVAEAVTS